MANKKYCKKCNQLYSIINDILWIAIRYAHGRHTHAPSVIRDVVQQLKILYPDFKLKKDTIIKSPDKEEYIKGFHYRSDWLDDLFEEQGDFNDKSK